MANKASIVFCQNQIKKIKERMKNGTTQFGDKKRLKELQDILNGSRKFEEW